MKGGYLMPKKSTRKRTTRKSTTKKSTAKEQETKPLKDSEETLDTTTQGLSSKEQSDVSEEVVQGSIQKENIEPDVKEVIPAPEKKKPKTIYLFPQPVVTVSEGKVTHLKKE